MMSWLGGMNLAAMMYSSTLDKSILTFASKMCRDDDCIFVLFASYSGGSGADFFYTCGLTTAQIVSIGSSDTVKLSQNEGYCLV